MLLVAEDVTMLVGEAKTGSPDAWNHLFKRFQLPLYVYVQELVRNEQEALDIVQETFVAATRHIRSLRENGKFASWLFTIGHQRCVQFWRRKTRLQIFSDNQPDEAQLEQLSDHESDPAELLIRREQEERFFAILEQLPPAQRSVLLLHFVEDFSLQEIAEITETQLGTVKSRLHYAKLCLRKLLEEQNV